MSQTPFTHDPAAPERQTARQFEATSENMAGQRLDFALSLLLPQMGLRGRKRCIDSGLVLVNGRTCTAAQRLRNGDVVSLADAPAEAAATATQASAHPDQGKARAQAIPRFLERQGDLCFFFKPAGLHTAALAGSTAPSLEGMLPQLLPQLPDYPRANAFVSHGGVAARTASAPDDSGAARPQLLQRLDCGTSGIVCAALNPVAAGEFRRAEAAGRCEKRYVALLAGRLEEDFTVRLALRTDKRSKSRVLDCDAGRSDRKSVV